MRPIIFALALGVLSTHATAAEPRWPAVQTSATFTLPPGCENHRAEVEACADQMARFAAAHASASAAGKSLLVVFGATWCPSCKGLKTALPESLSDSGVGAKVEVVEITLSMLVKGKVTPVPTGEAVYAALKVAKPEFRQRAIPFIAMVDPATGRTSARNLDDVEQGGTWNRQALAKAVELARVEVNGGKPAPGEPGWLMRKWKRWIGE